MPDLITKLKKDHDQIKGLLSGIYDCIGSHDKKIEFVSKLNELLSDHIKTEDNELYPVLIKEAEKDSSLKMKLDVFAKDWDEISSFTNYYIGKYSKGNFDDKFTTDTAKLISSLRQRIIKEEVSLYSKYLKRK